LAASMAGANASTTDRPSLFNDSTFSPDIEGDTKRSSPSSPLVSSFTPSISPHTRVPEEFLQTSFLCKLSKALSGFILITETTLAAEKTPPQQIYNTSVNGKEKRESKRQRSTGEEEEN
ncbi:PREDICTED: uncharacterized protein LOC109127220, partial [Camelina sativa]|uniref:Uncharacterized protein LOC109127220 n=1 Tax=Camelina sativa TaxID=90675 RepID=A0ABM1QKK2_CAMSA